MEIFSIYLTKKLFIVIKLKSPIKCQLNFKIISHIFFLKFDLENKKNHINFFLYSYE